MLALLMQIEGIDVAALPRALKAAASDADPQTAERAAKSRRRGLQAQQSTASGFDYCRAAKVAP